MVWKVWHGVAWLDTAQYYNRMCTYMYVCVGACVRVCMYVYVHVYCAGLSLCPRLWLDVNISLYVYACMCLCVFVCMCA